MSRPLICQALIPLIGSNRSEEGITGTSEQPLALAAYVIRNRLLQISAQSTSRGRDDVSINQPVCDGLKSSDEQR